MSITEIPNKLNSPRLYCPNCTQPLPPDAYPFTFCSDQCMEEFNDSITPSEWLEEEYRREEEREEREES